MIAGRSWWPAAVSAAAVVSISGLQPIQLTGVAWGDGTVAAGHHSVRQWLAASSRQAGLDRVVRPHMFRRATANELLALGAGLDVVKELLGHASIRSTEAYLHRARTGSRRQWKACGPLRFAAGGEAT